VDEQTAEAVGFPLEILHLIEQRHAGDAYDAADDDARRLAFTMRIDAVNDAPGWPPSIPMEVWVRDGHVFAPTARGIWMGG
jgi:hypothetical protein